MCEGPLIFLFNDQILRLKLLLPLLCNLHYAVEEGVDFVKHALLGPFNQRHLGLDLSLLMTDFSGQLIPEFLKQVQLV